MNRKQYTNEFKLEAVRLPVAPNLLNRQFISAGPNLVRASGVRQVRMPPATTGGCSPRLGWSAP